MFWRKMAAYDDQKFVCLAVYVSNLDNFMTVILVHSFFNLLCLVIVQTHIAREKKALSYPLVLQARQVLRHQVYLKKFSEIPTEEDARGPPRNRKLQEKVQSEQKLIIYKINSKISKSTSTISCRP